eukprot:CAMPEP_0171499984 /NCGR_PEP_ID=MMETSP0958-20121227/8729_1 /TAXON_ID=87120 /ORGANISM="Aurantiochytrium limacinum, Strain ATCCMYA-1381" /LENGTH=878 /DNA_ID=CAMNT_0012034595 /DNA_START=45 /DNA_END=2681 /DNA_ORIENTATION=-
MGPEKMFLSAAVVVGALLQACSAGYVEPMQHVIATMNSTVLPAGVSDLTATVVGSKVFLFGGCLAQTETDGNCTSVSKKAYMFDPEPVFASRDLVELEDAPNARYRHMAGMIGDKIFIIGGSNGSSIGDGQQAYTEIDIYDTTTGSWSTSADVALTEGITDGTAFTINDVIYVVGGWTASWSYFTNTISITETNLTYLNVSLNVQRGDVQSVILSGEGYVIGGYGDGDGDNDYEHLNTVERFDPTNNTWYLEADDLSTTRGDSTISILNDRVYTFGGQSTKMINDNDELTYGIASIEVLYSGDWRYAGELGDDRFRAASATIDDTVYIFGGATVNEGTTSEISLLSSIVTFTETSSLYSLPTVVLQGSGTTNPSTFFWHVFDLFHSGTRIPVKMTYRAIGSGDGQSEMMGNEASGYLPYTQFGSGDIPFSADDYANITEHHVIAQIPFAFGAVSVYVNIPELRADSSRSLVITACNLAKIYNGDITNWNELASASTENSWLSSVDQTILPVHRDTGSSSTSGFTTYLNDECSDEWSSDLVGKLIDWPCSAAGTCTSDSGSGGIQEYLEANEYSIGYLSVSHGYPDELSEITLVNKNGDLVQSSTAGIQKAASAYSAWPSNITSDYSDVSLINTDGSDAFPIVLVSYLYVRQDLTSLGSSAALLKAFLQYVLNEDMGQELMTDYSFVPLTDDLRTMCLDGVDNLLEMPADVTEFVFESDTTLVYTGAGAYVISEKREVITQTALEDMDDDITDLEDRVSTLEDTASADQIDTLNATIQALVARVASLESGSSSAAESDDDDEHVHKEIDQAMAIATAAIVISVIELVLLLILGYMLYKIHTAVSQAKRIGNGGRPSHAGSSLELSQASSDSASAAVRVV